MDVVHGRWLGGVSVDPVYASSIFVRPVRAVLLVGRLLPPSLGSHSSSS